MKTIIIDGIEYNLTPKVLFKKGDFVVIQETTYQITKVENLNVTLSLNGRECLFDINVLKNARLWDIAKDAKDGDVLVMQKTNVTYESIFIFNKIENNRIIQYLHYFITDAGEEVCEARSIDSFLGFVGTTVHPATKEQRDTLMKAMADAGYTFDFEKKELKKVGCEADCTTTKEWSEEDEQYLLVCKNALAKYQVSDKWDATIISRWLEDKLKSLKERYTWKPSKGQMKALNTCIMQGEISYVGQGTELQSLYNDLKKFTE